MYVHSFNNEPTCMQAHIMYMCIRILLLTLYHAVNFKGGVYWEELDEISGNIQGQWGFEVWQDFEEIW